MGGTSGGEAWGGGAGGESGVTAGSGGSGGSSGGGGTPANRSPSITGASAPGTLTPTRGMTVTVRATDPDGLDDLADATLYEQVTQNPVATSSGTAGSYTFALTWSALRTATPFSFTTTGMTIVFDVRVNDRSGGSAAFTVQVAIDCDGAAESCCNGTCANLQTSSQHCGTCGNDCSAWGAQRGVTNVGCAAGACIARIPTTARTHCQSTCSVVGLACHPLLECPGYSGGVAGCWWYTLQNGSPCPYPTGTGACGDVPPATAACATLGTASFRRGECACR